MFYSEDKPAGLESFDSFNRTQHLKDFYEERLNSLSKQLQLFFAEIDSDEIFKAMQENSLSKEFAVQRASELFTEIMKSEKEVLIHKQQSEIIDLKTSIAKLDYEKQKTLSNSREIEERLRKAEQEKDRNLHEIQLLKNRLDEMGFQLGESEKRKDFEWMQKFDLSMRKMEDKLQDSEAKYLMTRKELESTSNMKKSADYMASEVESLRRQMKNQELLHSREVEDIRSSYEIKVSELERSSESLASQFKDYQKKSEDLAANQQSVIKSLVDKSKQLKQKIISQKSKLQDCSKISKESSVNLDAARSSYERNLKDLEDRLRSFQKEAAGKENDLALKHQTQLSQLQIHYQQMMDLKLSEMQKEVDEQVRKSQDHDREVRNLLEGKMREIERDYLHRSVHEKLVLEKEAFLAEKYSGKMEELRREADRVQSEMQNIIDEYIKRNEDLRYKIEELQEELVREKGRFVEDLNSKGFKLKETETQKNQLVREIEKIKIEYRQLQDNYNEEVQNRMKADNDVIGLQNSLAEAKSDLTQSVLTFKAAKSEHEQVLSEKIDKNEYAKLSEKLENFKKDIEKKNSFIRDLQDEVNNLENSLRELKLQRSSESKQTESEFKKYQETKSQIKELQLYSENLLLEVDFRDKANSELRKQVEDLRDQVRVLTRDLEGKEKDLYSFKVTLTRESESRVKLRTANEKLKKYIKNNIFHLRKQLGSLGDIVEHEYGSMNKYINTVSQDLSIKTIELELKYRKMMDSKAEGYGEDIRSYYKEKIAQVEEFVSQENVHWNDLETEGIRRAVKGILEKKYIYQVEIKSLKESVAKLTDQNENLYRENQKLQIRLHANNEAFDQLQREVTEEAHKIKQRLEVKETRSPYYRN